MKGWWGETRDVVWSSLSLLHESRVEKHGVRENRFRNICKIVHLQSIVSQLNNHVGDKRIIIETMIKTSKTPGI